MIPAGEPRQRQMNQEMSRKHRQKLYTVGTFRKFVRKLGVQFSHSTASDCKLEMAHKPQVEKEKNSRNELFVVDCLSHDKSSRQPVATKTILRWCRVALPLDSVVAK